MPLYSRAREGDAGRRPARWPVQIPSCLGESQSYRYRLSIAPRYARGRVSARIWGNAGPPTETRRAPAKCHDYNVRGRNRGAAPQGREIYVIIEKTGPETGITNIHTAVISSALKGEKS